jgi:hypothetical protein
MAALLQPESDIAVGNDAGWALAFHSESGGKVKDKADLLLTRDQYYAEIDATLPGDLSGGSYRFTIEGLTDDDHAKIAQTPGTDHPTVVRLYLFWRDTASSVGGYVTSALGLSDLTGGQDESDFGQQVAELAITKVSRRLGERRYETVVEASERVYAGASKRLQANLEATGFKDAVTKLAKQGGFDCTVSMDEKNNASTAAELDKEKLPFEANTVIADALTQLSKRVEQATKKTGRSTLLIREGKLYFGIRPIPLEGKPKVLSLGTGLVETELQAGLVVAPGSDGKPPKKRRQFRFTLKGRPDLKPGDVVSFDPPAEEGTVAATLGGALGGALGGLISSFGLDDPKDLAYVSSVQHSLGRTRGFATVVSAVELDQGESGWDAPPDNGSRAYFADDGTSAASASGGEAAAAAIKRTAQAARDAVHTAEVGEVRTMYTKGSGDGVGQTLRMLRGLAPPDGKAGQANRLAVDPKTSAPIDRVPYLTPFAWGKAGLVLPRYPGTRVVVVHRNGEANDPIEAGAVWQADEGPESTGGDWWLILPSAVAEEKRASAADTDAIQQYAGKASDDLIDAEGNRVIEVGSLTIRVGPDALDAAGSRPDKAAADSLTIAFGKKDETSIVLKDGEIHLKAKKIVLEANGVTAELTDAMDVT